MAMDITGASLTRGEVQEISSNIEQISKDIDSTMKSVSGIMTTLTDQSEGGLIKQTTTAVQQLNGLCETLVACILNIGIKIGDYLKVMFTQDGEAAEKLKESIGKRVYEN